jgi:hypothetical protein
MLSERMVDERAYWSHTALKLHAGIDVERLRTAWQRVSDLHDMLRTGFVLPVQEEAVASTVLVWFLGL